MTLQERYASFLSSSSGPSTSTFTSVSSKASSSLQQKRSSSTLWSYDTRYRSYFGHGGAGNNWAMGYTCFTKEIESLLENQVRSMVENCDTLSTFHVLLSTAGGTGSGLGSSLIEYLRDEYDTKTIVTSAVTPTSTGDVIVQDLNSTLSLSRLFTNSDGVFVLENEAANDICTQQLGIAHPSLHDLNNVMSTHLTSCFLPFHQSACPLSSIEMDHQSQSNTINQMKRIRTRSRTIDIGRLIHHLCPNPNYNVLSIRMSPQVPATSVSYESNTWQGLNKRVIQMHISGVTSEYGLSWSRPQDQLECHFGLKHALICRGHNSSSAFQKEDHRAQQHKQQHQQGKKNAFLNNKKIKNVDTFDLIEHISDSFFYPSWANDNMNFGDNEKNDRIQRKQNKIYTTEENILFGSSKAKFNGHEKVSTLISNSDVFSPRIQRIVDGATNLYRNGAFIHQYTKFGVSEKDIQQAIVSLEQILVNYKLLAHGTKTSA